MQERSVDGLVLLTHRPDPESDSALLKGELRANRSGCITVGGTVVVLPSDDELLAGGSVVRNGVTYVPGREMRLGGGLSPAAPRLGRICDVEDYFVAGSGH